MKKTEKSDYIPPDTRFYANNAISNTKRKCNRCGELKQPAHFPLAKKYNTQSVDGLYHLCTLCTIPQDADEQVIKLLKYESGAPEFKNIFKDGQEER